MAERYAEGGQDPVAKADDHSNAKAERNAAAHLTFERKRDSEKNHQRRDKWKCKLGLEVNFIISGIDSFTLHVGDLLLQIEESKFLDIARQQREILGCFRNRRVCFAFLWRDCPVHRYAPLR